MAWVNTTEHVDGRRGTINELQVREYTRVFMVETSTPLDDPGAVRQMPGVPRIYDPYTPPSGQQDVAALVRLVDPEPTDSPTIWKVTVRYSSDVDSLLNANPLLRPAEVSYSAFGVAIPAEWDVEGKPIRNAAGVPFDPPLEKEEMLLVMRVTRNLPTYDALAVLPYLNSINSKAWQGLKPFSTQCKRLDGTRVFEQGKLFWRWDCEFHIRWLREPANRQRITPAPAGGEPPGAYRSWTAWLLNRGYLCKPLTASGKLQPCRNSLLQEVSSPVPLAADGSQLALTENPLYLGFDYLYEKDFNDLPILPPV